MDYEIKILLTKDENNDEKSCSVADYSYLDYVAPAFLLDSKCPRCSDVIKIKVFIETYKAEDQPIMKHEVLIKGSPIGSYHFEEEESYDHCDDTKENEIVKPIKLMKKMPQNPIAIKNNEISHENQIFQDFDSIDEEMIEERLDEDLVDKLWQEETNDETTQDDTKPYQRRNRRPTERGEFICDICSAKCNCIAQIRRHMQLRHLPEQPIKYNCTACIPPKPFRALSSYAWHMNNKHPELEYKAKKFTCPICKVEFRNTFARETHYRKCGPNSKAQSPTCHLCQKVYRHWKSVIRHVEAVHFKAGNFNCTICGFVSSRKLQHEDHMETHKSNNPRPYKCPHADCGKRFKTRKSRQNHLTHIHKYNSETEAICEACGEAFQTRAALSYHISRQHREREVYPCPVCNKELHTKYSLKTHMATVHVEPTENEKFPCDQCDYVGIKLSYLEIHKLQHADPKDKPKCSYCGKAFINKNLVRRHEMIHLDARPHVCQVCNRCFRHSFDLKSHMRLHTG